MKKMNITWVILCILIGYKGYSQNPYWALEPALKFNLSSNSISSLPGGVTTISNFLGVQTNGLFDAQGNMIFFVANEKVYDKNGVEKYNLSTNGYTISSINIIPVPGGTCGEYFVIYVEPAGPSIAQTYNIKANKVTVDASQNITVSNLVSEVVYEARDIGSPLTQTAISKESNGRRTLYVTLRRLIDHNGGDNNQIGKVKIDQNGLTKETGFLPIDIFTPINNNLESYSLELSPNQRYLAWIDHYGITRVVVKDLLTGTMIRIDITGLGAESELEFGPNSNDLYVTTQQGLARTSMSQPTVATFIPGSYTQSGGTNSTVYYGGNVELGPDNMLYITSASAGHIASYDIANNLFNPNVVSYLGKHLPEQVDGETILYYGNPLSGNISIAPNGNLIAQASGGSGNYSYTWNTPGSPNYGTSAQLTPCGRAKHVVTIKDNLAGCSVTLKIIYTAPQACLSLGPPSASVGLDVAESAIKVYPNPVSEYLNVTMKSGEQIEQLQVRDLSGQIWLKVSGNNASNQRVGVQRLKKGTYILTVTTNQRSSQQRVVID